MQRTTRTWIELPGGRIKRTGGRWRGERPRAEHWSRGGPVERRRRRRQQRQRLQVDPQAWQR